ncbi:MAG TPA: cation:proton antiporter family protein, partial [Patescibacteria group bacterium]|nr:cation:proton antiporter family protein [Patescibacteria group bacterium]
PALTFSSTIIVVKLLSEKRDLQSLYGKLAVGIFLTQDLVAILILVTLASTGASAGPYAGLPLWQSILMALVRDLILVLLVWLLSAKVFPKITQQIGSNEELMLVFSLAWALGLAAFVALPVIGFNVEIGGFLAGLSLARSGVHYEISGKIKPIRDFFIIIFFIVLGSGLSLQNLAGLGRPVIILSLFVLVGEPLIVMLLLGLLGYKPRTGFFAGVTVAQISEFSLILATVGLASGQLSAADVALVTLVCMVTIAVSSYLIVYSSQAYQLLKPLLQVFDFRHGAAEKHMHTVALKHHIVLVGADRLGHHLIDALRQQQTPFVVVDFNPEIAERYAAQNLLVVCGDINDEFVREQASLAYAKIIISTVPDLADNLELMYAIKKERRSGRSRPKLIFVALDDASVKTLYQRGVDYVISPHFMGGQHLAKILADDNQLRGLKRLRENHLRLMAG